MIAIAHENHRQQVRGCRDRAMDQAPFRGRTLTTARWHSSTAFESVGSAASKKTGTELVRSSATHMRCASLAGRPTSATRLPESAFTMVSDSGASRASRGLLNASARLVSESRS